VLLKETLLRKTTCYKQTTGKEEERCWALVRFYWLAQRTDNCGKVFSRYRRTWWLIDTVTIWFFLLAHPVVNRNLISRGLAEIEPRNYRPSARHGFGGVVWRWRHVTSDT